MTSRPRSDLYINLPALRKLDHMLLVSLTNSISDQRSVHPSENKRWTSAVIMCISWRNEHIFCQEILESFRDPEFWYVDQGICPPDRDGSAPFMLTFHRRDEKWWLPVPRVPPGGVGDTTRRQLEHKRDCASQILKAAMAINSNALAEMDVPDSYLDSLPKVQINSTTCRE